MAKLDEQFMAGGGGGVSMDNGIEIQTVEEGEKITTEKDGALEKQKIKLLAFLIKEGFLSEQGDGYVIKKEMLDDTKFKQRLNRVYLGRNSEGKIVFGGLRRVGSLLGGLAVGVVVDDNKIEQKQVRDIFDNYLKKETPKEKVINILIAEGVIRRMENGLVVDVERLKSGNFWKEQDKDIFNNQEYKLKFNPRSIYKLLGDIKVVSVEDYKKAASQNSIPKAKALFNIPASVEEAFMLRDIKIKKYYLDVWEMYQNVPWRNLKIPTKDGNEIDALEEYLFIKIFKELRGYRENKGKLMIFDQQTQGFIEITATKLRELKVIKSSNYVSMLTTLSTYCPNLLEKQLVKLDDFDIYTGQEAPTGRLVRKEKKPANTKGVFEPLFDSVKIYIGRGQFIFNNDSIPLSNLKVVVLDNKKLGIIRFDKSREELVYTITRITEEEKEKIRNKIKKEHPEFSEKQVTMYSRLSKKDVNKRIESYQDIKSVPAFAGELPEDYTIRLRKIPTYKEVKAVTDELAIGMTVGIHNLPWREQLQISQMSFEVNFNKQKKEFIKFGKKYGLLGLRTFLSLEQGGLEMGKKILNIGEKFKETSEVANAIFEKYAELVDAVDGVEDYLKEQFGEEDPRLIQEIKENLLIRGKAILVMFAGEEMIVEVAMERLKEVNTEVDVLGTILRAMKNKGEKIDLNIVKDLSILSVYKLDENAINDVMALAKDSWDQNVKNNGVSADFAKVVINGLRGELESDRMDTEINVLKYQDKPIGMIRFQTVDDKTLVVKSINIHSQLKGINIGTFLFELIRKKAQEKNLKLNVLLKNQVSCHYISELGFYGYGYNDNVKETNEPNIYAKLEKGKIKNRNEKYFTKQEGDIERSFNISTQKGLKEMRNFLKEHLLTINDKGDIIEGQKYENKCTIVEQIQVGRQDDIRKIILRKNSVL